MYAHLTHTSEAVGESALHVQGVCFKGVYFNVLVEMVFAAEGLPADITLVGPLSSVNPPMPRQLFVPDESFVTSTLRAPVRSFT